MLHLLFQMILTSVDQATKMHHMPALFHVLVKIAWNVPPSNNVMLTPLVPSLSLFSVEVIRMMQIRRVPSHAHQASQILVHWENHVMPTLHASLLPTPTDHH